LRVPYERSPGVVGYRCPSEPVHTYLRKGGKLEDTVGRKCLCNGLAATVDIGQERADGYVEARLVTLGSDLSGAEVMIKDHPTGWSAGEAVSFLLGK